MPEVYFRVRWPDGTSERCYSPSTVKYGFGCGNAQRQLAEIERTAAGFAGLTGGQVIVEGFER